MRTELFGHHVLLNVVIGSVDQCNSKNKSKEYYLIKACGKSRDFNVLNLTEPILLCCYRICLSTWCLTLGYVRSNLRPCYTISELNPRMNVTYFAKHSPGRYSESQFE